MCAPDICIQIAMTFPNMIHPRLPTLYTWISIYGHEERRQKGSLKIRYRCSHKCNQPFPPPQEESQAAKNKIVINKIGKDVGNVGQGMVPKKHRPCDIAWQHHIHSSRSLDSHRHNRLPFPKHIYLGQTDMDSLSRILRTITCQDIDIDRRMLDIRTIQDMREERIEYLHRNVVCTSLRRVLVLDDVVDDDRQRIGQRYWTVQIQEIWMQWQITVRWMCEIAYCASSDGEARGCSRVLTEDEVFRFAPPRIKLSQRQTCPKQ